MLENVAYARSRRFREKLEQWLTTIRMMWPECPACLNNAGTHLTVWPAIAIHRREGSDVFRLNRSNFSFRPAYSLVNGMKPHFKAASFLRLHFMNKMGHNHTMKSPFGTLCTLLKAGLELVGEGLEMMPVTGPVKNVTGWISGTLVAVLVGVKVAMYVWPSGATNQIAVWVAAASFVLAISAMLLQWNRSLLWQRSLLASAGQESASDALRHS
jgi:hypothetical protein